LLAALMMLTGNHYLRPSRRSEDPAAPKPIVNCDV
jgi:hypothetical protein